MNRLAGLLWAGMLFLALAPGACSRSGAGDLQVSWSFADGRRCTDNGVSRIEVVGTKTVADSGGSPSFACGDGESRTVQVAVALSGAHLVFRGVSSQQAVLYQGELSFDDLPRQATVVLYATGAH